MGGSQLKQLNAAISSAGLSRSSQPNTNSKKRKRGGAILEHREKRVAKLNEIHEQFNQFDVKVTKLKHDVGGRKLKGVVGKPTASKQAGIEQRKKTLLAEYNVKGKNGGFMDRRFGENDPTMSLEERMLERFTRERQRTSKAAMFNLEDEEELTHYGQSLSKFDDFDDVGILDDEDEDGKGQIDAATVKKVHFGGFSDEDEDEDDGPPRKKTKAEVMAEVIAKSKEHKYARQQQKEQDEDTRHQLNQDFDDIRGLLFTRENMDTEPTTKDSATALGPYKLEPPPPVGDDYDQLVRELIFDKRSQPKDRTKTEEEIAQEEKEALEKAERARLRRMMGEDDEESDEEDERRKRRRGGDDLDDDFMEEGGDEGWAGIGTGLTVSGAPQASDDDEDASEHTDPEQDDSDEESESSEHEGENGDEDGSDSDESNGGEEHIEESLKSTTKSKGRSKTLRSPPRNSKELPFTFPCPSSHEEFLEILEGVDQADIGTVVERIRKLHHPSLGEKNQFKLQDFTSVLLDHIIYVSGEQPPALTVVDAILPHLVELSKAYPIRSAEESVKKLKVMQKNLNRGLQDPLSPSSKTFPGTPELILLRVLGGIWSTSDMKHAVVGPARYLIGAYLALPRIRSLADIASGLFLCTLFYEYEQDSKRFVPEVINFLTNAVLLLAPTSFKDETSMPGTVPTPDFGAEHTQGLRIRVKKARDLQPGKPALFAILNGDADEQAKVDLLTLSMDLLGRFAEMYKPLDAFIEIYAPVLDILKQVQAHKLSTVFQAKLTSQIDTLSRLQRFSREGRRPLLLQAHKPIPIATYIPKFESHSSSYLRSKDPDAERAAAQKLRAQYRQEKKGAMRELRKDNRFLAAVVQERKEAQDKAYNERRKKVMGGLEGERAEQRREEKAKAKEKRRAGKK